jgi:ribosomal protein S18 acetylase RimI-like enzyme
VDPHRPVARRLDPTEVRQAVSTLRDAFLPDPLFRWLLPDDARRATWLEWFHLFSVRQCMPAGGVFTLSPGGPESGALAILPPGAWPIPMWRMLRAVPLPRAVPTKRLAVGGLRLLGRMEALHPSEPHIYVSVIGVAPEKKGKGLGGALLRHACTMADEHRLPAYLETGNEDNLSLYERFGFRVEVTVETHGGPPLWTMRRPASS